MSKDKIQQWSMCSMAQRKPGSWAPAPLVALLREIAVGSDMEQIESLTPDEQMKRPSEVELWILGRMLTESNMKDVWKTIERYASKRGPNGDDLFFEFYCWVVDAFDINTMLEIAPPSERERCFDEIVECSIKLARLTSAFGVSGFLMEAPPPSIASDRTRKVQWIKIGRALGALQGRARQKLEQRSFVTSNRGNPAHVQFQRALSTHLQVNLGRWVDDVVAGVASSLYPRPFSKDNVKYNRRDLLVADGG